MITRWFLLVPLLSLAYLSGFFHLQKDPQLFFRNMPHVLSAEQASHVRIAKPHFVISSQVQQLGIGYRVATDLSSKTPSKGEDKPAEWGKSKQIDKYTWTLQVGQDARNGTAQELLAALNSYRQKHGKGTLSLDEKLAKFAQERADYFIKKNDLDGHAGFSDYLNNQDGFKKLGFGTIGENSSFGYTLESVHLIEWVYAGDKPHDDNQLSSKWSYVGIGVAGTATDLVFAGSRL